MLFSFNVKLLTGFTKLPEEIHNMFISIFRLFLYVSSAIHLFTPDLENYLNDLNQCIKTWKKLNQISSCCLDKRRSGDKLELEGFSDAHWRISTSIHRMVLKKSMYIPQGLHTTIYFFWCFTFSDFWCAIGICIMYSNFIFGFQTKVPKDQQLLKKPSKCLLLDFFNFQCHKSAGLLQHNFCMRM